VVWDRRASGLLFVFFFTLVTGPIRSLSLELSDTRVYEPQIHRAFEVKQCKKRLARRGFIKKRAQRFVERACEMKKRARVVKERAHIVNKEGPRCQ